MSSGDRPPFVALSHLARTRHREERRPRRETSAQLPPHLDASRSWVGAGRSRPPRSPSAPKRASRLPLIVTVFSSAAGDAARSRSSLGRSSSSCRFAGERSDTLPLIIRIDLQASLPQGLAERTHFSRALGGNHIIVLLLGGRLRQVTVRYDREGARRKAVFIVDPGLQEELIGQKVERRA